MVSPLPDPSLLASESLDKTLRVWSLLTGECEHVYERDVSSKESRYYYSYLSKFNREVGI